MRDSKCAGPSVVVIVVEVKSNYQLIIMKSEQVTHVHFFKGSYLVLCLNVNSKTDCGIAGESVCRYYAEPSAQRDNIKKKLEK